MITISKVKDSGVIHMRMCDGQEMLCEGVMLTDGDTARILYISDQQWAFDMGKALLNAADLAGVLYCYWHDTDAATAKRLRFKVGDDVPSLDLNGYFDKPCVHNDE